MAKKMDKMGLETVVTQYYGKLNFKRQKNSFQLLKILILSGFFLKFIHQENKA